MDNFSDASIANFEYVFTQWGHGAFKYNFGNMQQGNLDNFGNIHCLVYKMFCLSVFFQVTLLDKLVQSLHRWSQKYVLWCSLMSSLTWKAFNGQIHIQSQWQRQRAKTLNCSKSLSLTLYKYLTWEWSLIYRLTKLWLTFT